MYKIIRLLLVLVALVSLAGFGWTFYDFWTHRDQYLSKYDVEKLESSFPTPLPPPPGHLLEWPNYAAVFKLNVTGVVEVEDSGPGPAAEQRPKARIVPADLRVVVILFSSKGLSSAWIEPTKTPARSSETTPVGDVYFVGDSFSIEKEPGLAITVEAIREAEVDLRVEGQDELLTLPVAEYVVETDNIRAVGGAGAAAAVSPDGAGAAPAPAQGPAPVEQTTELLPDTWQIGTADLEQIARMPEDEIYAAVKVQPERAEDGSVRGLRIRHIRQNSLFEKMGVRSEDILLSVNGYPATDRTDLMRWLREQRDVRSFSVQVERYGAVRTLSYRVPRRRR